MKVEPIGIHNKLQRCLLTTYLVDGTKLPVELSLSEREIEKKIGTTWEVGCINRPGDYLTEYIPPHMIQLVTVKVLEEYDMENKVWVKKGKK